MSLSLLLNTVGLVGLRRGRSDGPIRPYTGSKKKPEVKRTSSAITTRSMAS